MEQQNIIHVNIEKLKEYDHNNSYADDYLVVSNSLDHLLLGNDKIKLDLFLMLFCLEGHIQIELNDQNYELQKNDLLLSPPNHIIGKILASPNHVVEFVCLSTPFLQRTLQFEKNHWKIMHHIHNNPVKHLNKEEVVFFNQYRSLINSRIQTHLLEDKKEILQFLFGAFFCEMMAIINQNIKLPDQSLTNNSTQLKQADFVFKRFMEELMADSGKHRSVTYYANKLCYSSKYLSRIIKQIRGKNALAIINEHAIECIKYELKYSSKSIKEIALEFEFPNLSFFTKFTKKYLGMTPSKYRSKKDMA